MSRYYNVYKSLKPRRGMVTAVVAVFLIVALVLSLVIAFWLVPLMNRTRGGDTNTPPVSGNPGGNHQQPGDLIALAAPTDLALDTTMTRLSWTCADSSHAVGYSVKINGVVTNVYTNPVTVNLLEGVESAISVKARGNNKEYSDSPWSEELVVTKADGLLIAYQTVLSSMRSILNTKVRNGTTPIEAGEIYAIDALGNNTADVWYAYTAGSEEGLACSNVRVPALTDIVGYKNKIDQIAAVINDNDITTVFLPAYNEDATAALLARADLTGTLKTLQQQGYTLTPVCFHTTEAVVTAGKATITFRGILRAEKGSAVRFFSYHYTAATDEVTGYTSKDYIDALDDAEVNCTFAEITAAAEISALGKEMLSMYLAGLED